MDKNKCPKSKFRNTFEKKNNEKNAKTVRP